MPAPRLATWTLLAACVTPVAAMPVWEIALAAGSGGLALLLSLYALYVCRTRDSKKKTPVDVEAPPASSPKNKKKPNSLVVDKKKSKARVAPQRSAPASTKKDETKKKKKNIVEMVVDLTEDVAVATKDAASSAATKAKGAASSAATKVKDVVSVVVGEANNTEEVVASSRVTTTTTLNPLVSMKPAPQALGSRKQAGNAI